MLYPYLDVIELPNLNLHCCKFGITNNVNTVLSKSFLVTLNYGIHLFMAFFPACQFVLNRYLDAMYAMYHISICHTRIFIEYSNLNLHYCKLDTMGNLTAIPPKSLSGALNHGTLVFMFLLDLGKVLFRYKHLITKMEITVLMESLMY